MKEFFVVAAILMMVPLGCRSTVTNYPASSSMEGRGENNSLAVIVHTRGDQELVIRVENKTAKVLILNWDRWQLLEENGTAWRLVHAGIPFNKREKKQTPTLIMDYSSLETRLTTPDALVPPSSEGQTWHSRSWIPRARPSLRFKVVYSFNLENKKRYLTLSLVPSQQHQPFTSLSLNKTLWHWFFVKRTVDRDAMITELERRALKRFGPTVSFSHIRFRSSWSPLSLLMGFHTAGWVEHLALEATLVDAFGRRASHTQDQ